MSRDAAGPRSTNLRAVVAAVALMGGIVGLGLFGYVRNHRLHPAWYPEAPSEASEHFCYAVGLEDAGCRTSRTVDYHLEHHECRQAWDAASALVELTRPSSPYRPHAERQRTRVQIDCPELWDDL